MALRCSNCGGIIPDVSNGGAFSGCGSHIKPEINIVEMKELAPKAQSEALSVVDEILKRLLADVDDNMEFAGTWNSKEHAAQSVESSINKAKAKINRLIDERALAELEIVNKASKERSHHIKNNMTGRFTNKRSECVKKAYIDYRIKELSNNLSKGDGE